MAAKSEKEVHGPARSSSCKVPQLAVLPVLPSHAQPSLHGLPVVLSSEALYTVDCHSLKGNACSLWLPWPRGQGKNSVKDRKTGASKSK